MIAVCVSPESMTIEQYAKVRDRLHASGAPETGRKDHSCFGEDDHLMAFDIWDRQEDFDALVGAVT